MDKLAQAQTHSVGRGTLRYLRPKSTPVNAYRFPVPAVRLVVFRDIRTPLPFNLNAILNTLKC